MKTMMSRFEAMMMAVSFAEEGEFDMAQELIKGDSTHHEPHSSCNELPSGTIASTPALS